MSTQTAVPGDTEERRASKSFRTVLLLCTPSYFALLMHVGALGFLDKGAVPVSLFVLVSEKWG